MTTLRYELFIRVEYQIFWFFTRVLWNPVASYGNYNDACGAAHNIFGCPTSRYYRIFDHKVGVWT